MKTLDTVRKGRPLAPTSIPSPAQALRGLVEKLAVWQRRIHDRRHLANMSDERLKDIGITRAQAQAEAAKPFWRA